MGQKLAYINQGREGYVVYKDGQGDITLYFEYGGGDCVAIINVPAPDQWTAKTKRPIGDRDAILTFVAEQAVKDQAPGGYYQLSDIWIEIFTKRT